MPLLVRRWPVRSSFLASGPRAALLALVALLGWLAPAAADELELGASSSTCGNGVVEAGEECDGTDCCSPGCTFAPVGSICSDGNACNGNETCDGAGSCLPGGFFTCNDNNPCTVDSCDLDTGCVHEAEIRASCEDGWAKKVLRINEQRAGKEQFQLKLNGGPRIQKTAFGDPTADDGTGYGICLFDGSGGFVGALGLVRAGERCAGRDCWRSTRKGYRYQDRAQESDGVQKASLIPGAAGSSRIHIRGGNDAAKGLTRFPAGLAAALLGSESATVQIVRDDSPACFSATFDRVLRNHTGEFRAR